MRNLLIVEDDKSLLPLLSYNLQKNGFNITSCETGEEAWLLLKEKKFDLALIDWMIPPPTGIKICKMVRQNKLLKNLPIILLTAKSEDDDKILGLNSGADDYIVKPFKMLELIARIKSILRRTNPNKSIDSLEFADLKMNLREMKVFRAGKIIHLGPTEFKLLRYFLENPGRVFSREQLLNSIWGDNIFIEIRTIDTHVRRLRKAINICGCKNLIRTIRAFGYSIDIT